MIKQLCASQSSSEASSPVSRCLEIIKSDIVIGMEPCNDGSVSYRNGCWSLLLSLHTHMQRQAEWQQSQGGCLQAWKRALTRRETVSLLMLFRLC